MNDKGYTMPTPRHSGQGYLYKNYEEPVSCPVCGSDDIIAGRLRHTHTIAWREVTCETCNFEWREDFVFVSWKPV